MADLNAIADGMATEFAAVTAPAGQTAIVDATAQNPTAVTGLPYVLIEGPQDGVIGWGASTRSIEYAFLATFFLSQVPAEPFDIVALRLWLPGLIGASLRHAQLAPYTDTGTGQSLANSVKWWRATKAQLGIYRYGGQEYNGAQLELGVSVFEPIAPSS